MRFSGVGLETGLVKWVIMWFQCGSTRIQEGFS